jgi:hypothetical protein
METQRLHLLARSAKAGKAQQLVRPLGPTRENPPQLRRAFPPAHLRRDVRVETSLRHAVDTTDLARTLWVEYVQWLARISTARASSFCAGVGVSSNAITLWWGCILYSRDGKGSHMFCCPAQHEAIGSSLHQFAQSNQICQS